MDCIQFEKIYRDYKKDVYRYLLYLGKNHHLAEDLMQETFARAYVHLKPEHAERVRPWLLRVAYRVFIDKMRKESRIQYFDAEYFNDLPEVETPETSFIKKEKHEAVCEMLCSLTEVQRQSVLLYDFKGFSYQESADMMGIGLSRFKILLYRARQKLRKEQHNQSVFQSLYSDAI
ncbi:sigma-70 family RNA polymerase sigma factor [Paenibacillus sp. J22TS3]|uniref:sigma-70 family RNA polymerase sigma factor n=1 Tax=Paenibacillus sp. J22TS3 TaxID=2807192 RepID=UPI001B1F1253|nr:sigma-70 family RNA polymerase sigma factor [Paenibacillus sp. J22TS3]GIP21601.1 ECF RNA polymerase sigma factor SigM [Paenibacillus sp. J22TS3]